MNQEQRNFSKIYIYVASLFVMLIIVVVFVFNSGDNKNLGDNKNEATDLITPLILVDKVYSESDSPLTFNYPSIWSYKNISKDKYNDILYQHVQVYDSAKQLTININLAYKEKSINPVVKENSDAQDGLSGTDTRIHIPDKDLSKYTHIDILNTRGFVNLNKEELKFDQQVNHLYFENQDLTSVYKNDNLTLSINFYFEKDSKVVSFWDIYYKSVIAEVVKSIKIK